MSAPAERIDVVLNRLCLFRTRSEAKRACDSGAVLIDGRPARPSDAVRAGDPVELVLPQRRFAVRLLEVPTKQVSRKAARDMYEILRDEALASDA